MRQPEKQCRSQKRHIPHPGGIKTEDRFHKKDTSGERARVHKNDTSGKPPTDTLAVGVTPDAHTATMLSSSCLRPQCFPR